MSTPRDLCERSALATRYYVLASLLRMIISNANRASTHSRGHRKCVRRLRSLTATSLVALAAPAMAADAGSEAIAASAAATADAAEQRRDDRRHRPARRIWRAQRPARRPRPTPTSRNIPQALTVISASQIEDQQLRSVADAADFVPGASLRHRRGQPRPDRRCAATTRTADFFVDGVRDDVQYFRDFYNVDRVEVLKGPNAMIFGRGGGGGIVNRVHQARRAFSDYREALTARATATAASA